MRNEFDTIVAGAGPAGTIFSYELAKAGFDVLLIDRKPKEKIGEKVCGDGISAGYFDILDLAKPSGKELTRKIDRSDVFPPNKQNELQIEGKGYTINRLPFGQRLLERALNEGVHFLPETSVKQPLIREEKIRGILAKNDEEGEFKVKAQVTMDATGMTAALRTRVPKSLLIEPQVDRFDIDIAHRYVAKLPKKFWKWREKSINIYINQEVIPGGYGWVFPKQGNKVNIGVGIQPLKKGVTPKEVTHRFLEELLEIKQGNLEILNSGSSIVPVRRPLSMIVTNGLVLAGDSASNANPIHGGGIGHAMEAAHYAAQEIIPKLEEKNEVLTKEDMWNYPKKYFTGKGGENAALQIIRLALQGFSNKEVNYIINNNIITGDQLLALQSDPEQGMGILEKISTGIKLVLFHRKLYKKLKEVRNLFERMYVLYQNYPEDPNEIEKWHKKVKKVIRKTKEKVWRNPYRFWRK